MNARFPCVFASVVLFQSSAFAEEPRSAMGGRLEAEAGIAKSIGSDFEGCLELQLRAMIGGRLVHGGVEVDLGTALFANHRVGGAFVFGIATDTTAPSFVLLGQAGFHSYYRVCSDGCGLFDKTAGGEGTVPYFGLHIGLAIPLGEGAHPTKSLILSLTPRFEPWSTRVVYSSVRGELLSDRTTTENISARLGGAFEVGAGIGASIDWN